MFLGPPPASAVALSLAIVANIPLLFCIGRSFET
jgi:hypothetical protein